MIIVRKISLEIEDVYAGCIKGRLYIDRGRKEDRLTTIRNFDRDFFMSDFERCIDILKHDMLDYVKNCREVEENAGKLK